MRLAYSLMCVLNILSEIIEGIIPARPCEGLKDLAWNHLMFVLGSNQARLKNMAELSALIHNS